MLILTAASTFTMATAAPGLDSIPSMPAPAFSAAEGAPEEPGLRAIVYEGVESNGTSPRFFAWLGLPEGASPESKVPGVVLVHGGQAGAIPDWVRLWNRRGYAAIAMSHMAIMPKGMPKLEGTPAFGDTRVFSPEAAQGADCWQRDAVGAVLRARALLASLPEVDPAKVGITGVSWGGYLTSIAASIDPNFAFAAPVYGCGFLAEDSAWSAKIRPLDEAHAGGWTKFWDPSSYVSSTKVPFFWVTGAKDRFYPLGMFDKTASLCPTTAGRSYQPMLQHGHGGPGENPPEIPAFADFILGRGGLKPLVITPPTLAGSELSATLSSDADSAALFHTADTGPWTKRTWHSTPAQMASGKLTAPLPEGTTAAFFQTRTTLDAPSFELGRDNPKPKATLQFSSPLWQKDP